MRYGLGVSKLTHGRVKREGSGFKGGAGKRNFEKKPEGRTGLQEGGGFQETGDLGTGRRPPIEKGKKARERGMKLRRSKSLIVEGN